MTGLEDRLRRVPGVADLTVELGDEGLRGIRVRIEEGSDEADVLEEIRRILVAYGLRSRRSSLRSEPVPEFEPEPSPEAVEAPRISVSPRDGGLEVAIQTSGRRVAVAGEATPLGAAEAMAKAVAEWEERPSPDRVAFRRVVLDDEQILVVLVRTGATAGAGAALVGPSLAEALHRAAFSALEAAAPTVGA